MTNIFEHLTYSLTTDNYVTNLVLAEKKSNSKFKYIYLYELEYKEIIKSFENFQTNFGLFCHNNVF